MSDRNIEIMPQRINQPSPRSPSPPSPPSQSQQVVERTSNRVNETLNKK